MSRSILVVGLGNLPLPRTRHSVGHYIVDSLAERLGIPLKDGRDPDGFLGKKSVPINGEQYNLSLFKPRPLMNIQGPAIAAACKRTVPSARSMIVIQDSLQHSVVSLNRTFGTSPGGHRGIRSIQSALKKDIDFWRLRIGIGRRGDAAQYVLGPLSSYELFHWGPNGNGLDDVWSEIEDIARQQK